MKAVSSSSSAGAAREKDANVIDPELVAESPTVGPRMLRQFAAVWLTLLGVLAGWSMYRGHDRAAIVFAVLALAAGPLGLRATRRHPPAVLDSHRRDDANRDCRDATDSWRPVLWPLHAAGASCSRRSAGTPCAVDATQSGRPTGRGARLLEAPDGTFNSIE